MYERYWHLDRPAFESDFETEFYYPARSHQGALLKLRFALEHRKGIGLLVGDHGVGKTYLTQVIEQELSLVTLGEPSPAQQAVINAVRQVAANLGMPVLK